MIKHKINIQVVAPSQEVAKEKAMYLEQLSRLDTESLFILSEKSRKTGIGKKLKQFQHLI